MALILDGIEYDIGEPFDIAVDMADFINDYCARNNIRNSQNELMRIDVNNASVIWLLLFALGYRESIIERLLYTLGCNFNIAMCSDEQLLNLAEIARVRRKQPAPTSVVVTIGALQTGAVTISRAVTATVNTPQGQLVFTPVDEAVIPAGASRPLIFVADRTGAYALPANAISAFDTPIAHIDFIHSAQGTQGNDWEPLADLRRRINVDNKSASDEDLAMQAITALPGVASCNIFTNYTMDSIISINGLPVPPRNAVVFINGYNPNIAAEYYKYMSIPPIGGQDANVFAQDYTTLAGQVKPFFFHTPAYVEIFVKVVIDIQPISERISSIQDAILALNGRYAIGRNITTADILNEFRLASTDYNVLGAHVSPDDAQWTIATNIGANQLFTIPRANIRIEQWEAP